jgi:hypothetical protein
VLLVLRWQPPMGWLGRARPLDRVVTLLNARAVTVYLWHNIAIDAVWPVLTLLALDDVGHLTDPVELAAALAITGGAVLAFGWVEDLAARRRPRLLPLTAGPRTAPDGGVRGIDGPAVGGPAPWDTATMPQQRTDLGSLPADAYRHIDQRGEFGGPARDQGRPAHRRDDGEPPTGRSSAPVPWFGGDS